MLLWIMWGLVVPVQALVQVELNKGVIGQVPVVISTATANDAMLKRSHHLLQRNLSHTGRVQVLTSGKAGYQLLLQHKKQGKQDSLCMWLRPSGAVGEADGERVCFDHEALKWRDAVNQASQWVYKKLVGHEGYFLHKMVYVRESLVQGVRRWSLEMSDYDGAQIQVIVSSSEPLMSPALSHDGTQIAYVSYEGHRSKIVIYDRMMKKSQVLASFPGVNSAPAWSPDGRTLAVALSLTGSVQLYAIDRATHAVTKLSKGQAIETNPAWSYDGKGLYFVSNRRGGVHVFYTEIATGKTKQITLHGDYNVSPSVSRDGQTLAYLSRVDGQLQVVVLNQVTGEASVVGSRRLDDSPRLSADGEFVVFSAQKGSQRALFIRPVRGGDLLKISGGADVLKYPAWIHYHRS